MNYKFKVCGVIIEPIMLTTNLLQLQNPVPGNTGNFQGMIDNLQRKYCFLTEAEASNVPKKLKSNFTPMIGATIYDGACYGPIQSCLSSTS